MELLCGLILFILSMLSCCLFVPRLLHCSVTGL